MPSLLPLRPVHAALRNSASKKQSHEPSWSEEQAGHRQRRESTRAWADGGRGLISSRPLPVPPEAHISIPHLPHLLPLARQGFGETGRRSEAVWSPHPPSPAFPPPLGVPPPPPPTGLRGSAPPPHTRRALGEGEAAGPGGAGRTPGCYVSGRERGSWTRPRPLTCARRRAACLPRDRRPHCSSASTRGREAAAAGEKSSICSGTVSWLGTLPSAQWLRGWGMGVE